LWITSCHISGSGLPPTYCQPSCLSYLLRVCMEISSLPFLPSPLHFQWFCFICCALVFSSLFILQVFLWGYCQSAQGAVLDFSGGWQGEYRVLLGAHLFGLSNVSQAGLELVAGGGGTPPVFSV
jgi:hypothetical protein